MRLSYPACRGRHVAKRQARHAPAFRHGCRWRSLTVHPAARRGRPYFSDPVNGFASTGPSNAMNSVHGLLPAHFASCGIPAGP